MAQDLDSILGDVFDSRELIERLSELESSLGLDDGDNPEEPDEDEVAEYQELKEICEEGDGYFVDWTFGVTLIADSYFETYAQELAEDIGAISRDLQWPAYCIDWERAADELRMDYGSIEIRGATYWGR